MKTSLSRIFTIAAATAILSLTLAAQTSSATNRILSPIDETNLVTLHGNVHPLAQARFDRGPAPVSTPTGRIMLVLERSTVQQQALTQYLSDLQNPSSPNYHKWLTPAQYGSQFGISDADLQTVQTWLQAHGFKIEKVPQARNVIEFSGNFEQIQAAFHTSIHNLFVNGENHFANMTDPEIPAALAPVVAGVGPLNDFHPKAPVEQGPRGHYDAALRRIVPDFTLSSQGTPLLFLDPADASTIYDTPNTNLNANYKSGTTYDGTGISIGIGGTSDLNLNDIENYRTGFLGETTTGANLPTVIVDGNDPGIVNGWAVEALLDNEVSGGLAPKAKIYFYTSADTDLSSGFVDAVYRALDDNAVSILSLSIASCEEALGNAGNQEVLEGYEQAAAQGITVVVAASDNGSAGCDDFDTGTAAQYGFAVNGFASTPYNVAVGGTDFDGLPAAFSTYASSSNGSPYYGTALKYIPENPWNDSTSVNTTYADNVAAESSGSTNIIAGSGGFSSCTEQTNAGVCEAGYGVPAFQTSVTPAGLTNSNKVRMIPDVSFFAGNGNYDAAWVVCSDPASDGSTQTYTECQNTNGTFSDTTYFAGVGGTSAAAPAFAGMLALVAQAHGSASDNYRLGQIDPILYQLAANATTYASVFHDITVGNNSVVCASGSPNCGANGFLTGYNAGSGYDLASGFGSADINLLVKDWTNVSPGSTSTMLNINGSTAAYSGTHGATLSFSVGVTPTTASGFAAIIDNADETSGGTSAGPQNNGQIAVPITTGAGSVSYNGLPGGKYTVYARYGGDTTSAASSSAGISVDISAEPSTTALQVDAYNPQTGANLSTTNIPYGSVILADAEIEGTAEGTDTEGTATGTVTFRNGSSTLGTASVSSTGNLASYPAYNSSYTAFAPGSYSMTAAYSGDASYNASTSTAAAFSVVKASTSISASASPTTVSSGGSTTVSVAVETLANDGAVPTGSVALSLGGTTLTTISNLSLSTTTSGSTVYYILTGTGTVEASQLAAGSNTISVAYSGDTNYATSSGSVVVTGPSGGSSPSLSMSNSGAITVEAGATTGNTSTITVTPGGGFTGAVNLTCAVTTSISNPNDTPTCSIPSTVTISGTTAATATVTVTTTASVTSTSSLASPLNKFFLSGGATLALIFFVGIPGRRRAWRAALSVVALIVVAGAIGCGGGGGTKTTTTPGTTAGAYTVTVSGTDAATGKLTASTAVSLTVN